MHSQFLDGLTSDCRPRVDVRRISSSGLVEKGKVVMPKDEAKKKGAKKAPRVDAEKVAKGDDKSSSSTEFCDIFDVNYIIPSRRSQRTEGNESAKNMGLNMILTMILEKIDSVEKKLEALIRGLAG